MEDWAKKLFFILTSVSFIAGFFIFPVIVETMKIAYAETQPGTAPPPPPDSTMGSTAPPPQPSESTTSSQPPEYQTSNTISSTSSGIIYPYPDTGTALPYPYSSATSTYPYPYPYPNIGTTSSYPIVSPPPYPASATTTGEVSPEFWTGIFDPKRGEENLTPLERETMLQKIQNSIREAELRLRGLYNTAPQAPPLIKREPLPVTTAPPAGGGKPAQSPPDTTNSGIFDRPIETIEALPPSRLEQLLLGEQKRKEIRIIRDDLTRPELPPEERRPLVEKINTIIRAESVRREDVSSSVLQDPRTHGDTVPYIFEITAISVVETAVTEEGKEEAVKVELKGKGPPNSFVTLYIYSTPIIVTVETDSNGEWTYLLDRELSDGAHEVHVASIDSSGRILAKSDPIPFVKEAAAITITDIRPAPAPASAKQGFFTPAVAGTAFGMLSLLIIGALVYIGAKRRKGSVV